MQISNALEKAYWSSESNLICTDPLRITANPKRAIIMRVIEAAIKSNFTLRLRSHNCFRGYKIFPIKSVKGMDTPV